MLQKKIKYNNNSLYITGLFRDTLDFDPGPSSFPMNSKSASSTDIFILKLDTNGNFIWSKSFGGFQGDDGNSITIDNAANIYITGRFQSTVDFDPNVGIANLTSNGSYDIFILKLDSLGNFIWVKQIGGTSADDVYSIASDNTNNIYITGHYRNTVDFDPGVGINNQTSAGGRDIYIEKIDSSGSLIWVKTIGNSIDNQGISNYVDNYGNVYTTGVFEGTLDANPSSGINNLISNGSLDIFIQKLDANGNFIWANSFGAPNATFDIAYSITVDLLDLLGNIYTTGHFEGSADFDPGIGVSNLTSNGSYDIFIHKLGQDICSNFSLIIDSASNISCIDSGDIFTHTNQGLHPISYSWNTIPVTNDSIVVLPSSGIYTLSATDANNCNNSTSLLINGPASMSGFDLNANLIATSFRPVFQSPIYLDAFNDGCDTTSGQLILVLNQLTSFDSASITPNIISGDTLIWNFNALVYNSTHLTPIIYIYIYIYL